MKRNKEEADRPQTPEAEPQRAEAAQEAPPATEAAQPGEPGPGETPAGEPGAAQAETKPPETPEQALARELEEAKKVAATNFDKYLRLQAEFDNYKKRLAKEQADSLRYAQTPLLRDLLAVQDNLERALEHARSDAANGAEAITSGVEMVAKTLREIFERHGMTRIEALGQPFDPNLHEAMGVVETFEVPENQVLEECQAGYLLHDRIVRPAMVIVSKRAQGEAQEPPSQES